MILCNLKEILKQKELTATKISNDTGISRPTLTTLINNTNKGIQYETINKLCVYLGISVSELFKEVDDSITQEVKAFIKEMGKYNLTLDELMTVINRIEVEDEKND